MAVLQRDIDVHQGIDREGSHSLSSLTTMVVPVTV